MTSSYSSSDLRISKLRSSTLRWALAIARVTIPDSMGWPSLMPSFSIAFTTQSR